ncbi:ABC1 family-domain-containing protein [Xylogone sp. PMI_703]|nr:ABC1 family-domain-containing protein [Xylogone sp. PMI_703]
MAGKRLVDLAALFNASRGVAKKHVALRARQIDVYNQTSTLAKAVKYQTDRVTETAKAAAFLASRLNESPPAWTVDEPAQAPPKTRPSPNKPASSATESQTPESRVEPEQSTFQDVEQKPDTITHTTAVHDSAPIVQEPEAHLPDNDIKSGGPNSSGEQSKVAFTPADQSVSEQDEVPEGVNTAVFHSRRVARILGEKPIGRTPGEAQGKGEDTLFNNKPHTPSSTQDNLASSNAAAPAPVVPEPEVVAEPSMEEVAQAIAQVSEKAATPEIHTNQIPYELRESRVPSSRLGRLWNYSGLAVGMVGGAVSESFRRVTGSGGAGSYFLSEGNVERLVTKLSRMRGAALKLGQMISIQDSKMLPPQIQDVLQRVQDRADYMPPSQRDKVLVSNLGENWRDLFSSFDEKPMAAASIGQVHSAVLKSTGERVAVKVQYPGVADSIDSDLNNLAILLTASRLLPKGLFLDKTIANARTELAWECDYLREAECGRRFQELLTDETDTFVVPKVYPEASGKQVLTMEFMDGIGVTRMQNFTQEQKDWIGTQILRLCLREITEFRYMQTDPNWTNFLFNSSTQKLELLDFGASREYPEEFIVTYTLLLEAASRSDKKKVRELSLKLGYLTGEESKTMRDAHVTSVLTLAEPFMESSPEVYDFSDQTITERVKSLIPVMIRERLAPPPEETYSLHRKLSGAFLLCARLGSRVKCRELFKNSMEKFGVQQYV